MMSKDRRVRVSIVVAVVCSDNSLPIVCGAFTAVFSDTNSLIIFLKAFSSLLTVYGGFNVNGLWGVQCLITVNGLWGVQCLLLLISVIKSLLITDYK